MPCCSKTLTENIIDNEPLYNVQDEGSQLGNAEPFIRPIAENEETIDYFIRPNTSDKQMLAKFFEFHPHQPKQNIPFNAERVYFRKDGNARMWLTFRRETPAIFCSLCLAYDTSAARHQSFVNGNSDWKHIYFRIEEHEKSRSHVNCVDAYILYKNSASVHSLLTYGHHSLRKQQVQLRREILSRVVDMVKLIGKRCLSYRGSENEAAYTLSNPQQDHGNFLEIILLLSKYDATLKAHIDIMIKKSQKAQDRGSKQGGGILTFLSKTTVNYVITTIGDLIKERISAEVNEAGMYSVQLDTTQDITASEQCSVVLRYVHGSLFVALVKCTSTKGVNLVKMFEDLMKNMKIDLSKCVGNATDGASNMQGEYNGFSVKLSEIARKQVHIWCWAHVLNLVIADVIKGCVRAASIFALLNGCAVFIGESYKRMDKWVQLEKRKRLHKIGETRWWSKHTALSTIFGSFGNHQSSTFVELLLTFEEIEKDEDFTADVRCQARSFIENLCKYETILCAQLFLRIFEKTTPFSKYLQTKGIDMLKVFEIYAETVKDLKTLHQNFQSIQTASQEFVRWGNKQLEMNFSSIVIDEKLPEKRRRKAKKMFSYEADDDVAGFTPEQLFEYDVYNVVVDRVVNCMEERFQVHGLLCADFSCLDPKNFDMINKKFPQNALEEIYSIVTSCTPDLNISLEDLQLELKDFSTKWKSIKKDIRTFYEERNDAAEPADEELEFDDDGDTCALGEKIKAVHDEFCINCAYKLLKQYNLYCQTYPGLTIAYKLLLTLSVTQVTYERCFSKLKIIKNRLRNTLSTEILDAFMLMSCEKDLLLSLNNHTIIDRVALKSKLLTSKLIL